MIIDISTEAFSIRILSGIFQEFFKNSHRNSDWIPIGKAAIMKESRKIGKIQTLAYLLKMKLQLQPKRLEWRSSWFFQYEQCEASVNSWMNCCIKDEQFFCPKLVSLLFFHQILRNWRLHKQNNLLLHRRIRRRTKKWSFLTCSWRFL